MSRHDIAPVVMIGLTVTLASVVVAHAFLAPAEPADTLTYAICNASETRCEVREQVLVGVGCGPEKYTMVAREESDFPFQCEAISAHGVRPLVNGN